VSLTASQHAGLRPRLDEVSLRALEGHSQAGSQPARHEPGPDDAQEAGDAQEADGAPDALLWAALSLAPEDGIPVADLVAATGMSQRWVHYRLHALAQAGQAVQIRRGIWRAVCPDGDAL